MIDSFTGEYRWLSNFWPVNVTYDGILYHSVEHAYVAAKTLDMNIRQTLAQASTTAAQAKKLGRTLELRKDWEEVKVDTMRCLIRQKFCDPELRSKLLATGNQELIEGNWWGDTFWGVCKGQGKNVLGQILMQVREEIRCPH